MITLSPYTQKPRTLFNQVCNNLHYNFSYTTSYLIFNLFTNSCETHVIRNPVQVLFNKNYQKVNLVKLRRAIRKQAFMKMSQ